MCRSENTENTKLFHSKRNAWNVTSTITFLFSITISIFFLVNLYSVYWTAQNISALNNVIKVTDNYCWFTLDSIFRRSKTKIT